jgi:hypothetical protein
MDVYQILGLVISVSSIITVTAAGVRWLVKHYFDEIKAELKPNGGGSLKDQVNRLEQDHKAMSNKIDQMYSILLDHVANTTSIKTTKAKTAKK